MARDGRRGRGTGRHLPLAHRHRGVPVADRHLLRQRAAGALRAGLDQGRERGWSSARTGSGTARWPRNRLPWWNDPGRGRVGPAGTTQRTQGALLMAIEVRIPTIFVRTLTAPSKSRGTGSTLGELFADLEQRHGGLRDRLVDGGGLRRFVNVYLNDEDVRFLDGLDTPVKDGDTVTVLPAVAGGARRGPAVTAFHTERTGVMRYDNLLDSARPHAPGRSAPAISLARRPAVGQARGQQPDRFGQGPRRVLHGRPGREGGAARTGSHDPGAHHGQHRHLAGHGGHGCAVTG